ncbi:MAG TPA: hypothetical protein VNG51_02430 [Ktedonobacteraceae bacterium]|nr:hypothetical protein [Ktedonobacteraceae bacterium]
MATLYSQTWERTLLPLAYEAEHRVTVPTLKPVGDVVLLDRAYAYCAALTAMHSRTFYMATGLLPLGEVPLAKAEGLLQPLLAVGFFQAVVC